MAAPFFAAIGRMFASVAARAVGTRVAGGAAAKSAATRAMSGGAAKRATAGVASRAGGAAGRGGGKGGGTVASAAAPPPGPGPRSGGGAGGSGAGSTPPSGGRSPGDWRPVVDAVAKVGNAMNPFRLGSQIGRSVSDTIRNAVQGIAERRDSGAPMSAMQRILSGFVQPRQESAPTVESMPGLSPAQKLQTMGWSREEIDSANRTEQERQHKEIMEQRAAEETEKLKDAFKQATGSVKGFVVAAAIAPLALRRLGESIVETKRGDARYSGPIAAAFAKRDVQNIRMEQNAAQAAAPTTKALIEAQMRLDKEMANELLAIRMLGEKILAFFLNRAADAAKAADAAQNIPKPVGGVVGAVVGGAAFGGIGGVVGGAIGQAVVGNRAPQVNPMQNIDDVVNAAARNRFGQAPMPPPPLPPVK